MGFMDQYEPVADRIQKFWKDRPNGRIHTEIVLINEQEIVVKASVFTDRDDARPAAIDFAQEGRNSSAINKTSFVENCATSAIGRSLATLGYAPKDASKRPSQEEMKKVTKQTERNWASEVTVLAGTKDLEGLRKLLAEAKAAGAPKDIIDSITGIGKSLTPKE